MLRSLLTLSRCAAAALAMATSGCAGVGLLAPPAPHERYAAQLRQAGIDQTALGRDWLAAADRALQQPLSIVTPFRETGYLSPNDAIAVAYRFDLRRGRRLLVEVRLESSEPARLFADLFWLAPGRSPQRVAALADGSVELAYDVERDGSYVLRLQPELLRGGRFALVQRTLASLPFPVAGQHARAIQSGFGDLRDAGARAHEGVDIFAPRGTPVLAVAAGVARNDVNALGGNVVWLDDGASRRAYYYAHLDRWAGEGARRVEPGDTLGYVGNTGNARLAPPHLHFGIYHGGAVDPHPFIAADDAVPPAAPQSDDLGKPLRTTRDRVPLRTGPATTFPEAATIGRGSLLTALGVSGEWYRAVLPDGAHGYISRRSAGPAVAPLRRDRLAADSLLREAPAADAPVVRELNAGASIEVFATFREFDYARTADGAAGWIRRPTR